MAQISLSYGAIPAIMNGQLSSMSSIKPVLQVLNIFPPDQQRYTVRLSDGSITGDFILSIPRSDLVQSGKIQKGSIVKLVTFDCALSLNRRIITILDLQVILLKSDLIGVPRPFEFASLTGRTSTPSQPMNQSAVISLSNGAIPLILDGHLSEESEIKLLLQVLEIRYAPAANQTGRRYFFLLSDGSVTGPVCLAPLLNELVTSRKIQEGTIIKLERFVFTVFQNHLIIEIHKLHVIHDRVGVIGQPKPYKRINVPPSIPSNPMNQPATDMISLTDGSIQMILDGRLSVESDILPLLQVLSIGNHPAANQKIGERYILRLSDGSFTQQGMLAMQHNELVRSGRIQEGSIVRLEEFFFGVIQNQPTIVIVNLQVIQPKCHPIGVPEPFPWKDHQTATLFGIAYPLSQCSRSDSN